MRYQQNPQLVARSPREGTLLVVGD